MIKDIEYKEIAVIILIYIYKYININKHISVFCLPSCNRLSMKRSTGSAPKSMFLKINPII